MSLGSKERTLVVHFGVNELATVFKALEVRGGVKERKIGREGEREGG